jgi:glycosyltransferase involved in cell wall biosynthesis
MKISYAIPVCNEHEELKRLLDFLVKHIREEDEIVVQCDEGNTTSEVYEVFKNRSNIKVIEFALNGHFSNFKNNLKENCSGDWIFQIDADEYPDD